MSDSTTDHDCAFPAPPAARMAVAVAAAAILAAAAALFLPPRGDVFFTALDDSAQCALARGFARGFPSRFRDDAFAAVPDAARSALLYRPASSRSTRDIAHRLNMDTFRVEPFFQPFLPMQRAFLPGLPVVLALVVLAFMVWWASRGRRRTTLTAAVAIAAAILTPWPARFCLSPFSEGMATLLAALGLCLSFLAPPRSGPGCAALGFAEGLCLGLSVTFHPSLCICVAPVAAFSAARAGRPRHALFLALGAVAGLAPLVWSTKCVAAPYGDIFSPSVLRSWMASSQSIRVFVAVMAALACSVAAPVMASFSPRMRAMASRRRFGTATAVGGAATVALAVVAALAMPRTHAALLNDRDGMLLAIPAIAALCAAAFARRRASSCFIFAAAAALCAIPAWAKTYYVDAATGSDYNTGLKESQALKTIQAAIDKAAAGSTILVAPGTYEPIDTGNKKLTIRATEGWENTIIDGAGLSDAIGAELGVWGTQTYKATGYSYTYRNKSTGKKVTIKEYWIWSSEDMRTFEVSVPKDGEFVEESGSKPGMLRGTLYIPKRPDWLAAGDWWDEWESFSYGEAANRTLGKYHYYAGGSATTLEGFTVTGCAQALRAGTVSHCRATGNEANWETEDNLPGKDAVAYMSNLSDCLFDGNEANYLFWAPYDGKATAMRCEFTGNTVGQAVYSYCCISLFNCLFADNTTDGGILSLDSGYSGGAAYNCTIANNTIKNSYGAAVGETSMFDSIVWGNHYENGVPANIRLSAYVNQGSGDSIEKASCSMMNSDVEGVVVEQKGNKGKVWGKYGPTAQNSTGNISLDPCFINPAGGDYHLAPWSPCIDAGADYQSKTGKFDLDSAARKVSMVDMGAYELQPREAVPADYDGDGITDAAFFFGASGQWWIFQSSDDTIRTVSLPDAYGTPCPADFDGDDGGKAEIAYYTAAAKTPEFVVLDSFGNATRMPFGEKGATPVAARLAGGKATFGAYTANAKKPAFSFLDSSLKVEFGAKGSTPVVADFDDDGSDDLGVYTATASKPAFSILQSSQGYSPLALFNGGAVALGPKGAIPCCADYDGEGGADFGVYMSNTKEPYFQRLFSSSKFRETRTLPMGSKGDVPVVGVYEARCPATTAIWTGSVWTYVGSDWDNRVLTGK